MTDVEDRKLMMVIFMKVKALAAGAAHGGAGAAHGGAGAGRGGARRKSKKRRVNRHKKTKRRS